MEVNYKLDSDGVDWDEMKTILKEDKWDNGRTVDQYKRSFENSYAVCIAYVEGKIMGTVRVLSDGVGNAYVVDAWTLSKYRNQGIARTMMELVLKSLPGQYVYLQTDDDTVEFYGKIGFKKHPTGMSYVVGEYLKKK
jgi:ribosomal protein S18 acetylase RimI-like enzyme